MELSSFRSWHTVTRWPFEPSLRTCVTNIAHTFCAFRPPKICDAVVFTVSRGSESSLTHVKRLRLELCESRIRSRREVEGCPERGSSPTISRPLRSIFSHRLVCDLDMHSSLKSTWSILKVYRSVIFSRTQNFGADPCLRVKSIFNFDEDPEVVRTKRHVVTHLNLGGDFSGHRCIA